ncbi:molybdopterin-dependent oxidoreductase [Hyphomicrobium sp. B1]|uniref:molybdopterin-containing oxidoreductase family protein n=1 Tax=Hyphomicrobium sp. B1 TaxID=3075651 RepID=UPI003C2FDEE1
MAKNARRVPIYCSLCVARCGAMAVVEDGRFTTLEADTAHPTGQALCAKGRAAPELVYHRDRLKYPLRRTTPKGEADPRWQQISWNEALGLIADAMSGISEKYGPESVAFSLSSPSTTALADSYAFVQRLMSAFGSPNAVNSIDLCGWGRALATSYTFGVGSLGAGALGGAMPEISKSGCMILWGYNPSFSRLTHATAITEALKRDMRLIVIDPRHAGFASKADLWLRVRPGSDGALALGIANVMIERGWYDREFIRAWSNGPLLVRADTGRLLTERDVTPGGDAHRYFAWNRSAKRLVPYDTTTGRYKVDTADVALEGEYRVKATGGHVICHTVFELYARLCRRYSPGIVETISSIPANQVEETARLIWHSRPVSYYAWSGHEQHSNTTQTARAMSLLYALTGNFDAPGGNVILPTVGAAPINRVESISNKPMADVLGQTERPLGPARWGSVTTHDLYRAILENKPYAIRALIGFGSNMLLAHADSRTGRKALSALEFYAHADLFMTPTAELADIVLPAASCFEREALKIGFEISSGAQSHIQLRQAVVSPPGEARSDTEIVFGIASHLGLAQQFWNGEIEGAYRQQLGPTGITVEQLRAAPRGVHLPLQTRYAKYAERGACGEARGFATPSRKIELYSQTFLDHGYAPLPEFEEPQIGRVARSDFLARFPLILTSAKHSLFCQSQHRAVPSLRKHAFYPKVELHPDTAKSRGISEGDWVSIFTPEGSVHAHARLNDKLDPRVVVGEHGWWQSCQEIGAPGYNPFTSDGANLNLIIGTETLDPLSGTASHRSYPCEVQRDPK